MRRQGGSLHFRSLGEAVSFVSATGLRTGRSLQKQNGGKGVEHNFWTKKKKGKTRLREKASTLPPGLWRK